MEGCILDSRLRGNDRVVAGRTGVWQAGQGCRAGMTESSLGFGSKTPETPAQMTSSARAPGGFGKRVSRNNEGFPETPAIHSVPDRCISKARPTRPGPSFADYGVIAIVSLRGEGAVVLEDPMLNHCMVS